MIRGLPARRDTVASLAIAGALLTAAAGIGVASRALQGPPLGMDPNPGAACQLTPDFRPDAGCTPGEVMTTDKKLICKAGYSDDVRYVPVALRAKVLASYGLLAPPGVRTTSKVHLDHRLPLSLGGSNGEKNLAPIPATGEFGNSKKNTTEQRVRRAICDGSLTVQEGQARFLVVDPRWQAADDDLVNAQ